MRFAPSLLAFASMFLAAASAIAADWRAVDPAQLQALQDDDIERHRSINGSFDGLEISETRFSENGFDWHLLRFANAAKSDGPFWVVPMMTKMLHSTPCWPD